MACRCSSCAAGLPRVARFCPRCGIARRRRAGQPIALALILAGMLIVLSNLTMRAVTIGSTTAGTLYVPRGPVPAAPPLPPPPLEPAGGIVYDIESNPLVLLEREVGVRDMRLHGVHLGDAPVRIPRRFITRTAIGEMHCYDGNVYECRDDAVSAIVLNDPAILLRIPCGECLSVFSRFGVPDALEDAGQPDGDRLRFIYADRGMSVRWNRRTNRIDQIILTNPR